MKNLICFILFFSFTVPSMAVLKTISVLGGNWSNATAWTGAATPAVGDAVTALSTSGSITIDTTTATCASLVLSGVSYTGNVAFNAGATLTVAGGVTLASGQTLSGTGSLKLSAPATILSNGKTFPGSFIFNGGNGAILTLGDSWTVGGNFSDIGSSTLNGNTLNIGGSVTLSTGTMNIGTTSIVMNGSGTLASTTDWRTNLTINTAGTVTLGNFSLGTAAAITYLAGTVVNTGASVTIDTGPVTFNTGLMHWGSLITLLGSTDQLASGLILDGNFSTTSGSTLFNGSPVSIGTNLTSNGAVTGTSPIVFFGSGTWSGAATVSNPVTINTSGNVTISSVHVTSPGSLIYTGGTVLTSGPFEVDGNYTFKTGTNINFENLYFNGAGAVTLGSDIHADENSTGNRPGCVFLSKSGIVTFSGPFNLSCNYLSIDYGRLTFTAAQTITVNTQFFVAGRGLPNSDTGATSTLKSVIPGTSIFVKYLGTKVNCQVYGDGNFSDIDASLTAFPVPIYNQISAMSNVKNVYSQPLPIPVGFIP